MPVPVFTMSKNSLPSEIPKIGESDVFFRNLLESAPDAMIIVDKQGVMSLVNRQALRMFGYKRKEMIGQRIEILLPEAKRGWRVWL